MDRPQSDLSRIKGFLVIALPGHSLTLKKMTRSCSSCNAEYEATVYEQDGVEKIYKTECAECARKSRIAQVKAEEEEFARDRMKRCRESWRAYCGPQGIFGGKTFDNFHQELQPKAFQALNQWQGKSMVLYSPGKNGIPDYGVGKTHLVSALANRLIDTEASMRCPVLVITENDLLARIKSTFNRREDEIAATEDIVYQSLETPHLLIIDDVGKVKPKDNSFTQQVWFRLIDKRYISGKPIILTTNLDLSQLENHIGGAASDRLLEMAGKDGFIKLSGKSYRHGIKSL